MVNLLINHSPLQSEFYKQFTESCKTVWQSLVYLCIVKQEEYEQ